MNKKQFALLVLGLLAVLLPTAQAVEIPAYIKDPNDVKANITSIIDAFEQTAVGSQGATAEADSVNIDKRKLAAALYAQALTTRTNLLAKAKGAAAEKAAGKLTSAIGGAKDERDVLSNEVKPQMLSIAERLSSIVSLEAGIAALDGTMVMSIMPKGNTKLGEAD